MRLESKVIIWMSIHRESGENLPLAPAEGLRSKGDVVSARARRSW
jgi:hypothetical protein